MMPLRKFPTPPPEQAAQPLFAATVNLFPLAESSRLEAAGGIGSSAHRPGAELILNGQMIRWFGGLIVASCHDVLENKRG